jgi:cytoskeleton protein RodZ
MSTHPFFRELKEAREAKGLSLAQISDITRIAEHHLEALERGEVSLLPQAYVRAFLREYADLVGLKPDLVMQKYDAMLSGVAPRPPAPAEHPSPPPPPPVERPHRTRKLLTAPRTRWALFATVAIVLALVLWNVLGRRAPTTTEEIPFQSVLADKEKRLSPAEEPQSTVSPATRLGAADSLTLRGTTTDTVWVMVIIDQEPPKEYIFKPNVRFTMKAKDRFSVTLGNAGAVEFTLNQKKIGLLGRPGAVARNIELTRATLTTP